MFPQRAGVCSWLKICLRHDSFLWEHAMLEPAAISSPAVTVARPQPDEYAPYYGRYISLVQGEDILRALDQQRRETMMLLSARTKKMGTSATRRTSGAPK